MHAQATRLEEVVALLLAHVLPPALQEHRENADQLLAAQ